jgi:hypothetical protein
VAESFSQHWVVDVGTYTVTCVVVMQIRYTLHALLAMDISYAGQLLVTAYVWVSNTLLHAGQAFS